MKYDLNRKKFIAKHLAFRQCEFCADDRVEHTDPEDLPTKLKSNRSVDDYPQMRTVPNVDLSVSVEPNDVLPHVKD